MAHPSLWNETLEALSMEELAVRVERPRLPEQLAYVLSRSPFYREKLRASSGDAQALAERLEQLPFTTKAEILRDQEAQPPYGANLCAGGDALCRVHRTSGTTNKPFLIALTRRDVETTVECGARCFWAAGLRPEDTVFHCLNYCLWMGGYTDHQSLERTGATVVPFGVGNSRYLIELILELRPTAIHCTPSYLSTLELLLKNEFQSEPAELGLRKGLFGGEAGMSEARFRARVESVWGMKAMNANYGLADALSMFGSECEVRDGLHFTGQGALLVELLDPGTDRLQPFRQGARGELVVTNLVREAQPLVRYRTGDVAEIVGDGRCDCGRGGFRFRIIGRKDDMIVVKGINVFPNAVAGVLSRFLDVLTGEFQIRIPVTDPVDRALLRVEVLPAGSGGEVAALRDRIRKALASSLSFRPELECVPEGTLPRTQGKMRRVVRVDGPLTAGPEAR